MIGDALPAAPEPVDADNATEPAPPIDTAAAPAAPIAAEVSPPVQTAKARPASPSTPLADPRMAPGIAATPAPSLGPGGWAMLAILACITGWWWRRSRALAQEARHLLRQQRALKSANVRLRDESERLRQQATNDPLTGALNRQAFATALRELLGHVAHYNRPAWLAVIDLDHFKAINDRHGHLAGDSALKLVAGIVHERLVSADLFGRFGGDEFLIGLAGHDADSAAALAESLRQAVAEAAAKHAPPLPGLSLSIGLAHADPDAGYSADALFARADAALYEAKRSGRNRVVVANAETTLPETGSAARHL